MTVYKASELFEFKHRFIRPDLKPTANVTSSAGLNSGLVLFH